MRLLDRPDELTGSTVGSLDEGDEVAVVEQSGLYRRVETPDGRTGWIHKMTLGDVVDAPAETRARDRPRRPDGLPGGARSRLTAPTRAAAFGLAAQDHDVLVGDVGDERARVAVRAEPRARLVPDQVALRHEAGR